MARNRQNEKVTFTKHAQDRMSQRGIRKDEVLDCMNDPDSTYPGQGDATIFQKACDCGILMLKVVANIVSLPFVIITAYKTKKPK